MRYLISAAVLLGLTACGGGSEDEAAPAETVTVTETAPAVEQPSASASTSAETETAAPPAPAYDLSEACTNFGRNWKGDMTRPGFVVDSYTAESLVAAGDDEVIAAFQPVYEAADSAADTLGTTDYLDAEEQYDNAIVAANQACEAAGLPFLED